MNQNKIMNPIICQLLDRSNKTTIQTLVRNFDIERLGYIYADIIEDNFQVKRNTASFGVAVSELFADYKVNKIRLEELDKIMMKANAKIKYHYSITVKQDQTKIYNDAAAEFAELNIPISLFTRRCNKYFKSLTHQ